MYLILESKKIYLDIENYEDIIESSIDDIIVTERYLPSKGYHGEYQILLKKNIEKLQDLTETASKLNKLAKSFDKLMTYVIGFPIAIDTQDFYGSKRQIVPFDTVEGWESNYKDAQFGLEKKENPEQKYFAEVTMGGMTHWSTCKKTPLHELITVYQNYQGLDNISKMLIRFHALALTHEYDVKYLLLGKALEIAAILLPVAKNASKSFKHLPQEIQEGFQGRTISWLYEMSNYRFETRHAINLASVDNFHNEMTEDEYYDFMHLSDLLISYIIRTKLNLEPFIIKTK